MVQSRHRFDPVSFVPKVRTLLGKTALESLELASRGAPQYASYGIVIHYMHERGPQILPKIFYADQRYAGPLLVAFQAAAAEGFLGWERHGKPAVDDVPKSEPDWMREEIDVFANILSELISDGSPAVGRTRGHNARP